MCASILVLSISLLPRKLISLNPLCQVRIVRHEPYEYCVDKTCIYIFINNLYLIVVIGGDKE